CSHGTGGTAFVDYMTKIGCQTVSATSFQCEKKCYIHVFKRLLSYHDNNNYITCREYLQEGDKLYGLISTSNGVNITRDPIGMLKHYIYCKRTNDPSKKFFTINHSPKDVVDNLILYHNYNGKWTQKPNVNIGNIDFWLNYRYMTFHDDLLRLKLINIKSDLFFDMSDFIGDNILLSLEKIIELFDLKVNINPDKIDCKNLFMDRNFSYLPAILSLHENDLITNEIDANYLKRINTIEIFIVDPDWVVARENVFFLRSGWYLSFFKFTKEACLDITKMISKQDGVLFLIEESKFNLLIKNKIMLDKMIAYLREFLSLLEMHKKNKVTNGEERILKIFAKNPKILQEAKKIFNNHLSIIGKNKSSIVASWKYYQEFEKL
ncbi:DUF2972 domain-containing protein, partial [Campylobacter lari]|nr:DUF2972 domain-containing protein [Campylobacter lari]